MSIRFLTLAHQPTFQFRIRRILEPLEEPPVAYYWINRYGRWHFPGRLREWAWRAYSQFARHKLRDTGNSVRFTNTYCWPSQSCKVCVRLLILRPANGVSFDKGLLKPDLHRPPLPSPLSRPMLLEREPLVRSLGSARMRVKDKLRRTFRNVCVVAKIKIKLTNESQVLCSCIANYVRITI